MTRSLVPVIIALALVTALSCARQTRLRDTSRTPEDGGIAVPNGSRAPAQNAAQTKSRPCINLNTAGPDALMLLPGLGPGLARKIIDYRNSHGPFERPQ